MQAETPQAETDSSNGNNNDQQLKSQESIQQDMHYTHTQPSARTHTNARTERTHIQARTNARLNTHTHGAQHSTEVMGEEGGRGGGQNLLAVVGFEQMGLHSGFKFSG